MIYILLNLLFPKKLTYIIYPYNLEYVLTVSQSDLCTFIFHLLAPHNNQLAFQHRWLSSIYFKWLPFLNFYECYYILLWKYILIKLDRINVLLQILNKNAFYICHYIFNIFKLSNKKIKKIIFNIFCYINFYFKLKYFKKLIFY